VKKKQEKVGEKIKRGGSEGGKRSLRHGERKVGG